MNADPNLLNHIFFLGTLKLPSRTRNEAGTQKMLKESMFKVF